MNLVIVMIFYLLWHKRQNEGLFKAKKTRKKEILSKQIYHYLAKRRAENLFQVKLIRKILKKKASFLTTYQIFFQRRKEKIDFLKSTDGIYCLKSNLPQEKDPGTLLSSYRQRRKVEVGFSYLKGFVEIRPFYHQKKERVKAHILICILAYLLEVTVEYLLRKADFPLTFQEFIFQIKRRRAIDLEIKNIGKYKFKLPRIPEEIKPLLAALGIGEETINKRFFSKKRGKDGIE